MVLGTTAARPSAVPANTGCRSVCDVTIMVRGLHEMARLWVRAWFTPNLTQVTIQSSLPAMFPYSIEVHLTHFLCGKL